MDYLYLALCCVLLLTNCVSLSLLLIHKQKAAAAERKLKDLEFKFKANPSMESQMLLADLLHGDALFHVSRIAPEDVLIRRS